MTTPRKSFMAVRDFLRAATFERESYVDGLLIATLSKQHVLGLGVPGTAKSYVVDLFARSFTGGGVEYFERLLSKFSTPEELFGPMSIAALQAGRYERVTAGYLPTAHFAFVDEVFKCNSAMLNGLLSVLNERKFSNGDPTPMRTPLVTCVGASNETPEDASLDALYDRFALRFWIEGIRDEKNLTALLNMGDPGSPPPLTMTELEACQAEVAAVTVPPSVVKVYLEINQTLTAKGIVSSDRRLRQLMSVIRAKAWMNGRTTATSEDLMILAHCMWKAPKDRDEVFSIVASLANPVERDTAKARQAVYDEMHALGPAPRDRAAAVVWCSRAETAYGVMTKALDDLRALQVDYPTSTLLADTIASTEGDRRTLQASVLAAKRI